MTVIVIRVHDYKVFFHRLINLLDKVGVSIANCYIMISGRGSGAKEGGVCRDMLLRIAKAVSDKV